MGKFVDLTGIRFGKLLVQYRTENPKNKTKKVFWLCQCDCGKTVIADSASLKNGKATQCSHCAHLATGSHKRKSLVGNRYGKLVVTKMIYGRFDKKSRQRTYCECRCDCGNIIERMQDYLTRNPSALMSCGCAHQEILDKQSIDVVGRKYGKLIVLEELKHISPRKVVCQCDCGNIITVIKTSVLSGNTQSCGCLQAERTSIANIKDWIGYESDFGVKAIEPVYQNQKGQWIWRYQCPLCHAYFEALPAKVVNGHITSCGCRRQSAKEQFIADFLKSQNIKFKPQFSFPDCKYQYVLKFDFALLDENEKVFCLIEYDGQQHDKPIDFFGGYKSYEDTVVRDNIKNQYCLNNGIPLLRLKSYLSNDEIKQQITNIIYP